MAQNDRTTGLVGNAGCKVPCRAATTANITLSGLQTIDGVVLVAGDRVLVKDQTDPIENGIYAADTGEWSRTADADGIYDFVEGSLVRVNEGNTSATGWFAVTTVDPITVGESSIAFGRQNINNVTRSKVVATAGQTLVSAPTYQIGANSLSVYVNGLRVIVDEDYTETTSGSITFAAPLSLNDEVVMYAGLSVGNLTAAAASAVAVVDAGDYYLGATVEQILQEIASAISADVGNADVTFTNGSSARILRWNTPITANRTLTLSTSNAKEGASCLAVRGAGATGNFTIDVGGLVTLRAYGEWVRCVYDAGTGAWIAVQHGTLQSAEMLGLTVRGDESVTLTVGQATRTQRWSSASLTAERTATLSTVGAWAGARWRIERGAAGVGLSVLQSTAVLFRLGSNQWAEFEFDGTNWHASASGILVSGHNTSMPEVYDDFLGQEINGYLWQSLIGTDAECRQALVVADQLRGLISLTTGDDAAASMAVNGVQLQSALNWRVGRGVFSCEFRVQLSSIADVAFFVGMTDQVAALEMPFTLAAGDVLTSNASNAVGVLFDTSADTDNWWLVGVQADVDATKQNTALAPVAGTPETWRIDVDSDGTARFYRNGALVGSAMANSVGTAVEMTPVVAMFSRTAASKTGFVDFIQLKSQR